MEHKTFLRLALCGTTALVVVAAAAINRYIVPKDDIPLPFAQATTSLAGDLTKIGKREADVFKVTFPIGVDSETLTEDRIYLVYIPDDAGVTTNVPFDEVLTLDVNGSPDVDYFGYKYVTADAAIEKQNKSDPVFENRFPGQFFASEKARANDAQFGNALAIFENANGVSMDATNVPTGALFRKGSLYFLIVNESGNVTITVRAQGGNSSSSASSVVSSVNSSASATSSVASSQSSAASSVAAPLPVCGDGTLDQNEACDDGDTDAGDGCSATCGVEENFNCTKTSPSVCITYNEFVKNLADTNKNGTVSDNEALLLTLDLADAPSKTYETVKKYDINNDGVVNNTDLLAIFAELDILAP